MGQAVRRTGSGGTERRSPNPGTMNLSSQLMSLEVSFPSPTAPPVHVTAVNDSGGCTRCQRRDTWRHTGAKCAEVHTCALAPTGERHSEEHTHIYTPVACRGMHMCVHTHVQVTEVYTHARSSRATKYTYRGHRRTISGEGEACFQCAVESCHMPSWRFSTARGGATLSGHKASFARHSCKTLKEYITLVF